MKKKPYRDILDSAAADSLSRQSDLWPGISAQLERNSAIMSPRTRPLVAILIAVLTLFVLSGVAYALGRALGYIPGIGLVDNSSGVRVLAEPVSLTRDGVTLTISSVFVYDDRIELIYDVKGITPENDGTQAGDASTNPTAFCGGVNIGDAPNRDGDARLQLPDGTVLERDNTGKFPQDRFAMKPVFAAIIPTSVTKMTLVLDCIPWARRGAVPEHWKVQFELKAVPAGTVVGAPVIEIEPTVVHPLRGPTALSTVEGTTQATAKASAVPVRPVTMALKKIVPLDSMTVIYFSMDMENKDPSLVSIMPMTAYLIDSQGQKIQLRGNYVWQPFEHRVGSEFEFTTQSKPAAGPLTVVVENAVAYYAPLYVDPPQATPAEMTFSFDAGANPQLGQTWTLNNAFDIAGYQLRVTSAQATSYDEARSKTPGFDFSSQGYEYGYDFAVEADPSVKMQVMMDIISESPICWLNNYSSSAPVSSSIHYVQLCRDDYPTGNVRVQLSELSVLVENTWQAVWQP